MDDISIKDAKEQLEELIERAARGEDVRIKDARIGTVRLVPVNEEAIREWGFDPAAPRVLDTMPPVVPKTGKRQLGRLRGKIPPPPDDFFDPLSEEELKLWYGDNE